MASDLACQRARHGGRLADFWLWGPALAHARRRLGRHGCFVVGPEPTGETQGTLVYQRQIRSLAGRVATGTDRVERRTVFGGQVPATNRTTAPRTAHRTTAARTASAFRWSGTEQTSVRLARIRRIDIENACVGTLSSDGNQPSPTCCRRHGSSSVTTRYGAVVSKSAGGSLNATCAFSPMPIIDTSNSSGGTSVASRWHSATGSASTPTS